MKLCLPSDGDVSMQSAIETSKNDSETAAADGHDELQGIRTQTNPGCRKDTIYLCHKKKVCWQCPIADIKNYAHYHEKHVGNEKTKKRT